MEDRAKYHTPDLDRDNMLDFEPSDLILKRNYDLCKMEAYQAPEKFFNGDKSKDFYLGMAAAAKALSSLFEGEYFDEQTCHQFSLQLTKDTLLLAYSAGQKKDNSQNHK